MARVKRIYAENFQVLKVVDIADLPEKGLVHITGPNGAGKTSLLNTAFVAFGSAASAPTAAIRTGQDKAVLTVETDELKVTRRFGVNKNTGEQTTSLSVENQEGAVYRRPQELLDRFWSVIAMDPLSFARAKEREQYDELRRMVPLSIDIDALDAANKADYDARTVLNREARKLRDQAEGIVVESGLPESEIDVSKLIDDLTATSEHNSGVERKQAARERTVERIASYRAQATNSDGLIEVDTAQVQKDHDELVEATKDQIAEYEQKIRLLRERLAAAEEVLPGALAAVREKHSAKARELRAEADRLEKSIAEELPAKRDVEALRAEIAEAQRTNDRIGQRRRRQETAAAAEAKEAEAQRLTDAIAARDQQKREALEKAEMPIPGLGWHEGVVTYKSLPLSQASSAEQLRVSVAIAMAMNPKLKFLRVQEGPLLDDDSMALLAHMVEEGGYLCFIESIDPAGKVGYVLEEGEVAEIVTPEIAEQTRRPPRERKRKSTEVGKQEGLL